jgi:predicted membrane-bound spermidine synthase
LTFILPPAVFVTGFAALLYQVVWQRMLGLFTGSDVRSVTLIASAFLAGLGVGSLLGSTWADRLSPRQAVRIYGLCNLGIGFFAFFSRFLYYDLLFLRFGDLGALPLVLFVVVFISLLIPTTLMGLSLPLLSKALVRSTDKAARLITLIYGFNTLGAGIGTVVAGWFLVGTLGFSASVFLGGLLSLAVGALALGLSQIFEGQALHDTTLQLTVPRLNFRAVPLSVWGWCALVFTSGFIVISLEIIWFRVLDVVLKSNAYTYAHLLAFFLVGDALGSLTGARLLSRIRHPRRAFLWIQGLVALYSVLIIWFLSLLAGHGTGWLSKYILTSGGYLVLAWDDNRLQWLVYLGLPAVMLLPPSFLVGFYFPLVHKAVQTDTAVVGQRVGLVEVFNIAGNTLGGIITGLIFLHHIGTAASLQIIAALGLGFVVILVLQGRQLSFGGRALAGMLGAALLASLLTFPDNTTLWRRFHAISDPSRFFVAEDSTGVSAIVRGERRNGLAVNGRFQGPIPSDAIRTFLGAFPALVHPNPQSALVIGIGSAGTPYAVGVAPTIQSVLAVEIVGSELDVLNAYRSALPAGGLDRFFSDPRYEIRIGDGRRELVVSPRQFDIIEADALLPYSSHSGLLYSREYFEAVRRQLAEGGIMAQWRATNRVETTFVQVFPYVVVMGVVMLGSDSPIAYDYEAVRLRFEDPQVIAYFAAAGIDANEVRGYVGPAERLWTPDSPRDFSPSDINTDLFPRDEYYLNRGWVLWE